jgi:hypothetical protein
MRRIGDVISTRNRPFVCLQEVEINNYDMSALDNLLMKPNDGRPSFDDLSNIYGEIMPQFGNINTPELQSCAVTLYDKTKYEILNDRRQDSVIKMIYDLINPYVLDIPISVRKNNKLNIAAFRNRFDNKCIYVINIHADFGLMNNRDKLNKFLNNIELLTKIFGDRLYISGDFNVKKGIYDDEMSPSKRILLYTSVKKILTPELGEEIQADNDRTYDIIFSGVSNGMYDEVILMDELEKKQFSQNINA